MSVDNDALIDRAIDEAAHAMTRGEPSSAFRVEVMRRLDAPRRRPFGAWHWAAAAAAAAALMLTVGSMMQQPTGTQPKPSVAFTPLPSRTLTIAAGVPSSPRDGSNTERPLRTAAYRISESEVTALAPPRLDVPALAIAAMPDDSLEVSQLQTIAPIAIAPIDAPEGERR